MSGVTAADYEWLYQEFTDDAGDAWLCASFVHGVSPQEALRRMDITPGTVGTFGVEAYEANGGTVLIDYGWGTSVDPAPQRLSLGTRLATVFANIKNKEFTYFVDGEQVTRFDLYAYSYRHGDLPEVLASDLRELGLDRDDFTNPAPSALALASRATDVHLSRAQFDCEALVGSSDHLQ